MLPQQEGATVHFNRHDWCEPICLGPDGISGRGAGEPELCSLPDGSFTQCDGPTALPNADNPQTPDQCCKEYVCPETHRPKNTFCDTYNFCQRDSI